MQSHRQQLKNITAEIRGIERICKMHEGAKKPSDLQLLARLNLRSEYLKNLYQKIEGETKV
jgi:hypothetical protein